MADEALDNYLNEKKEIPTVPILAVWKDELANIRMVMERDNLEMGLPLMARCYGSDSADMVFWFAHWIKSPGFIKSFEERNKHLAECRNHIDMYHYSEEALKKFDELFQMEDGEPEDDELWATQTWGSEDGV